MWFITCSIPVPTPPPLLLRMGRVPHEQLNHTLVLSPKKCSSAITNLAHVCVCVRARACVCVCGLSYQMHSYIHTYIHTNIHNSVL